MGLRTSIKNRLGGLLHKEDAPKPAPVTAAAPRPPARVSSPAPKAEAPPPPPLSPEEKEKADKIAAHFAKARKGVLGYLIEKGGSLPMADMHDYSERRYFIAHQGFSRMMEGYVAEGLIDFTEATGQATITDAGRAFVSG